MTLELQSALSLFTPPGQVLTSKLAIRTRQDDYGGRTTTQYRRDSLQQSSSLCRLSINQECLRSTHLRGQVIGELSGVNDRSRPCLGSVKLVERLAGLIIAAKRC
jgi:hypothetical protein